MSHNVIPHLMNYEQYFFFYYPKVNNLSYLKVKQSLIPKGKTISHKP